jgi:hypothetical protein
MPTQIQLKDLKEDLTKVGEVVFRDESTGELVSEPQLDKKRGGFGIDVSTASGYPKLGDGVVTFDETVASSFDEIIKEGSGHIVVKDGGEIGRAHV